MLNSPLCTACLGIHSGLSVWIDNTTRKIAVVHSAFCIFAGVKKSRPDLRQCKRPLVSRESETSSPTVDYFASFLSMKHFFCLFTWQGIFMPLIWACKMAPILARNFFLASSLSKQKTSLKVSK